MSASQPHILVVDDDPLMRELISGYLLESDMRASIADGGAAMQQVLKEQVIDLVLLDLRLAGEDGLQLALRLRETTDLPVIVVSARHEEADRVMALEFVADDYITKPFSNRELLARVRAVLRRYQGKQTGLRSAQSAKRRAYRFSGWELNALTRHLTDPQGNRVTLGNCEFNLLLAFCEAPGRVLSREQLLELSRMRSDEIFDRSIDVQIFRLRRRFGVGEDAQAFIQTERGAGYRFDAQVEALR